MLSNRKLICFIHCCTIDKNNGPFCLWNFTNVIATLYKIVHILWHELWYSYKKWQKIIYSKLGRLNVFTFCTKRPDRTVKTQIRGVCGFDGVQWRILHFLMTPVHRTIQMKSTPTRLDFVPARIKLLSEERRADKSPSFSQQHAVHFNYHTFRPSLRLSPPQRQREALWRHTPSECRRYTLFIHPYNIMVYSNAWKPNVQNVCVQ